jgi:hypothetical protein
MERNFYNEEFEGFLKDKADQHRLYPSEKIWKNIHRQLHPRREWPYIIGALLLLLLGIASKYYVDSDEYVKGATVSANNITAPNEPAGATNNIASDNSITAGKKDNGPLSVISSRGINNNETLSLSFAPGSRNEISPLVISAPAVQSTGLFAIEKRNMPFSDLIPLYSNKRINAADLNTGQPTSLPATINGMMQRQDADPASAIVLSPDKKEKIEWQFYFTPTVSYRTLNGKATKAPYSYNGVIYSTSPGFPQNVDDAVTHKPSIGMELGMAMLYNVNKKLRIKAGMQFNYSQYLINAYNYVPEIAPYGASRNGFRSDTINVISHYRNFNGFTQTWLRNERLMISLPVGAEWTVAGKGRVQFNVAATIQPTYNLTNRAYLVSTNLKNYAEEPSLYRKWNVNSALETFLTINTGTVKWSVGPQFRYQLLSSYKNNYPIKEYLFDAGFKVGVNKTLK